jgi:PAS domain S-box-containing protein
MEKKSKGPKQPPKVKTPHTPAAVPTLKKGSVNTKGKSTLEENENLLRAFFDSPGMMRGIVEVVDDTTVRHVVDNQVTAGFVGLTPDNMRNKLSSELGEPPEIIRVWISHYRESQKSRKPVTFEYEDQRGGRKAWLSVTVNYLRTSASGLPQFTYVVFDTTEHKEVEQKLAEQAAMLATINDAIIGYDVNFRVRYWNQAAEKIYGYSSLEALGQVVTNLFKPASINMTRESLLERLAKNGHVEVESWRQTKDGRRLQIETHVIALHDDNGKLTGYAAVDRDVSERKQAEEGLRETRDYLDNLFNYANAPIIVWDSKFKITRFNHAFEHLTGRSAAEVIGREIDILFPPKSRKHSLTHIRSAVSKRWEVVEIPILHKDGDIRIVLWNSATLFAADGKTVFATIAQGQDITERKKAEETLQKARADLEIRIRERTKELAEVNKALQGEIVEHKQARKAVNVEKQRFNDVLEMLPVYVILLSPDYHVPFANRFFRERFGESRGKRCYEYLFGRDEPCENCETYKVLKTNGIHHWEWIGPDKHNYDIYDFPFTDADGSKLILEIGIDITEQKRAQAELLNAHGELETRVEERTRELRETRDYLDNLFNYANAPIIVWNPQFEITRFNHAFERLTGRTADEVLGGTLDILFPYDSHDESMRHIHKATSGERWEVVEIPIKHKDGTVRILLWNSANIYTADGKKVIATIAQGQDITERKKAEQLKDEFIALVSHELRTPMTVITGSLRTALSAGISPEDKQTLLLNAIEGAGSLSTILENLLELSRYQAGRLQIHREKVNIPVIAKSIIERLHDHSNDCLFVTDFPDDLPLVEADPVRVERILHNLLENAINYSSKKSEIKVFAQEKNGQVITGVADNGIGISTEDQARLFEPFERLGKATMYKGLGLGLVVCKRLVEAQGGKIWVESIPGKGSTFYFTLPINIKNN